jgi:DNA-binding response OmpR family regulator
LDKPGITTKPKIFEPKGGQMPKKILIVDDDVDTLRLVGLMLQRQGYQIVAANSGSQALVMASSEKPDLILLDVMMPDMDGYQVTKQLREKPETLNIPIVIFTAKSQPEDRITGFEVGADEYLTKPTQPRELFVHVQDILARKQAASPIPAIQRGHVVGILAAKGGMGISTLAVNLGITLQTKFRQQVIVAEFRPGEGSLALDLGFMPDDRLTHLLEFDPGTITTEEVEAALVKHSSGIRLLLSSYLPTDTQYQAMTNEFLAIAKVLPNIASYVLLDLGIGIHQITEKVLNTCDDLIVALEPFPNTVIRTKALMDELERRGFAQERVHIVLINRVRSDIQLTWNQVKDILKYPIAVAFTPVPELAYQSAKKNIPIVTQQPDSLISQQFSKLADLITKASQSV